MNIVTHEVGDYNSGNSQLKCHINAVSSELGENYSNLPIDYANGSTCIVTDTFKLLVFVSEPNKGKWEEKV